MPVNVKTQDGFFFGLCLLPPKGPGEVPELLAPLPVGGLSFPVLRLPTEFTRHQPPGGPPDPSGAKTGTAACWAEPTPNGPNPTLLPGAGVLTAAHVVFDVTAYAPMAPGTPPPYAVVGYAIDAAALYPEPLPQNPTPLNVCPTVVVGTNVDVYPRAGDSTAADYSHGLPALCICWGSVPSSNDDRHIFFTRRQWFVGKGPASKDAIGLYIGKTTPPGGTAQGVCQIMQQVVKQLAIDLYL